MSQLSPSGDSAPAPHPQWTPASPSPDRGPWSPLLDHALGPLGQHRVDLRVLAFNTRAIRCSTACGFRHEGTPPDDAWIDGAWHDDWIMGLLAHDPRPQPSTPG